MKNRVHAISDAKKNRDYHRSLFFVEGDVFCMETPKNRAPHLRML